MTKRNKKEQTALTGVTLERFVGQLEVVLHEYSTALYDAAQGTTNDGTSQNIMNQTAFICQNFGGALSIALKRTLEQP